MHLQLRDSLVFPEPGVSNESSQYGCEVAEPAESMVDSSGEVLVPFKVVEEIERQQCCDHTHTQASISCESAHRMEKPKPTPKHHNTS